MNAFVLNRDTNWRPLPNDKIVNWGVTEVPEDFFVRTKLLNHPDAVALAVNKIETLKALNAADVPTLEWCTTLNDAWDWQRENDTVIARRTVTGTNGNGIVVCGKLDIIPPAPLYTRYFKGLYEFRIHVVNGKVIDRAEKRRREGEEANNEVRNHDNGWVFCREGVESIPMVDDASIRAVAALGLDFGAVDIKCNRQYGKCAVLEVNTAPGMEGTTLERYAAALREAVL